MRAAPCKRVGFRPVMLRSTEGMEMDSDGDQQQEDLDFAPARFPGASEIIADALSWI